MGPIRRLIVLAALAFVAAPAGARTVTSTGPDAVSVTIYRGPDARPDEELDLDWLQGYALVTEQRTVTIPAGRTVIRFEGVAGGILPESAIVTGLPDGVREKNLDADLLNPRSLFERSLGRPVTIRRTIGEGIVEERAIIRSGPDGNAILQTRDGFLVANCGPPAREELIYDEVPAGLTPRPTLSVEVDAPVARPVTLTLSYLAWNFDWQANYVATMRPDGRTADLFAWVTLANGDVTSFAEAETMVVAGRLAKERRSYEDRMPRRSAPGSFRDSILFTCFASAITAEDVGAFPDRSVSNALQRVPGVAMSPAPPAQEVIVSGVRMSRREELGDLKLYRIPDRTTVAAMSQKQVGLLDQKAVPVAVIYRVRVYDDSEQDVVILLRARNKQSEGLGLPLPAGRVSVFEPFGERQLLVGEGSIADKAVGEEVEVEIAGSAQVTARIDDGESAGNWADHGLVVTNANPFPIRFEAELEVSEEYRRSRLSQRLGRKNGRDLWAVEVPANSTRTLRYRLTETGD